MFGSSKINAHVLGFNPNGLLVPKGENNMISQIHLQGFFVGQTLFTILEINKTF